MFFILAHQEGVLVDPTTIKSDQGGYWCATDITYDLCGSVSFQTVYIPPVKSAIELDVLDSSSDSSKISNTSEQKSDYQPQRRRFSFLSRLRNALPFIKRKSS